MTSKANAQASSRGVAAAGGAPGAGSDGELGALGARLARLPRAMQMLLAFAAFLALYFGVIEPLVTRTGTLHRQLDRDEAPLREYAKVEASVRASVEAASLGQRQFGELALPAEAAKRSVEFTRAVDDVLARHQITDVSSTSRSTTLPRGPMADAVDQSMRVDRLTRDLTFLATPEQLSAALADLERSPLVTAIPTLSIRQSDGNDQYNRKLRVRLAVETWVLEKKARTGG